MSSPVEHRDAGVGTRFMVDQRMLAVTVGVVVISLVVALLARWASPDVGTVPVISSDGRLYYIVALIAAILAGFAVQSHGLPNRDIRSVRFSQELGRARVWSGSTVWILPAALLAGIYALLAMYHSWRYVAGGIVAAGLGILLALIVRRWLVTQLSTGTDESLGRARLAHLLLTDAALFICLGMLYMPKSRTMLMVVATFAVSATLLFQLTDGMYGSPGQRVLYALAVGVVVAEIFWGLSYWRIAWSVGGLLLVIVFHALARLASVQLNTGLRRRDLLGYAGIGGVLFIIVGFSAL